MDRRTRQHLDSPAPRTRACQGLVSATAVAVAAMLTPLPSEAQEAFFSDVTDEAFDPPLFQARGAAFGDYDNDGWPDLFVNEDHDSSGDLSSFRIALLHNEQSARFRDRSDAIRTDRSRDKWKGPGPAFADYDNDGDLDVYVPIGGISSILRDLDMLLRNDQGEFYDVSREVGLTDSLPSETAIWLDYDRDGFLDLYVGHVAIGLDGSNNYDGSMDDPSVRNNLYRNMARTQFANVTAEAGLDVQLGPWGGANGGMSAADFNDDGTVDSNDLATWQAGFGAIESATRDQGDTDVDGDVDGRDFLVWQCGYGMTAVSGPAGASLSQAVPEPVAGVLAFGVLLATLVFATRRR